MSFIKKFLIALSLLTLVAVIGVVVYSKKSTYLNDEDVMGNTTGNIINGGLFSERNGIIYFSNPSDNGSLYAMNSMGTQFKKITDDKAVYINVDDNYIYYVRANYTREDQDAGYLAYNNTGIYRIDLNGKNLTLLSNFPGAYLTLKGNYTYYQNYDVNEGLYLYRQKIDRSEKEVLIKDAVIPSFITTDQLYYAGYTSDHHLNVHEFTKSKSNVVVQGNMAYPIFIDDYIYYLDLDDKYSLKRMKQDGSEVTELIDDRVLTYNITNSGKYLYYQVDGSKHNRLARLNLDTMKQETVIKGNYKQINITDFYVYFTDYENQNTYIQPADGKVRVSKFIAPNLSEVTPTTTKKKNSKK